MKNRIIYFTLLLLLFSSQSFKNNSSSEEPEFQELRKNQTLNFGEDYLSLNKIYPHRTSMGAYDGTTFNMVSDKKGNITISDMKGCQGLHQNEMIVYQAGGTISRSNDTLLIKAKTNLKHFYFFKIEKDSKPKVFTSDVEIKLVSKTLTAKYCPTLVRASYNLQLVALPTLAGTDEIYKAIHKEETVGVFKYLTVTDSKGKTVSFTEGDYLLLGGNGFVH